MEKQTKPNPKPEKKRRLVEASNLKPKQTRPAKRNKSSDSESDCEAILANIMKKKKQRVKPASSSSSSSSDEDDASKQKKQPIVNLEDLTVTPPNGLTWGDKVEVMWFVNNQNYWWPCRLDSVEEVDNGKWIKVTYDPLGKLYPGETQGHIRFVTDTWVDVLGEKQMYAWKPQGAKREVLKAKRTTIRKDEDLLSAEEDDIEAGKDSFLETKGDDGEFAETDFELINLPENRFENPAALLVPDDYSLQRENVADGMYCHICKTRFNEDSFSAAMQAQRDDNKRQCLRHSTASDHNRRAVVKL